MDVVKSFPWLDIETENRIAMYRDPGFKSMDSFLWDNYLATIRVTRRGVNMIYFYNLEKYTEFCLRWL